MRGTLSARKGVTLGNGIIPAYAGNTAFSSLARLSSWDHPRVCGEHPPPVFDAIRCWGSSPRMRGTHGRIPRRHRCHGIIPAYAGNTICRFPRRRQYRDHPRVCGEHDTPVARGRARTGSSPRMRGTLGREFGQYQRAGIIPAYAGNTRSSHRSRTPERDHPRVCGEHLISHASPEGSTGSSPRMRGTPAHAGSVAQQVGIIPAYAGNTTQPRTSRPSTRDHPRVCGEH